MDNGHVEIHGGGFSDLESPDTGSMKDSVEFRLIMAYAARRRPVKEPPKLPPKDDVNTSSPVRTDTEEKTTRGRKKKGWKRLPGFLKCVKPQTEELEESPPAKSPAMANPMTDLTTRSFSSSLPKTLEPQAAEDENDDPMAAVATSLTSLADDIPFAPPDIESDSPQEAESHPHEVETMIALLLRETGDRINDKELKDASIAAELFWNYSFFRSLVNAVLTRMGLRRADPDAPGPQASPKTQIAVACEITTRLTAVDTLPASRLLDHGARYLQDFFSPWARQQGGYEAAFQEDEDDEVQ